MTNPREISPDEKDVPAGWPRPFYRKDDKIEYVQWITEGADEQIQSCASDKTFAAGTHHLCTSCGEKMARGLIFDRNWINNDSRLPKRWKSPSIFGSKLGSYDTHYGGSICYRCALFAIKHCPMFSELSEKFGDDLVWVVTTAPDDTREMDETSGLEIVNSNLQRTTTADVRKCVLDGELFLVKTEDLQVLQSTKRPEQYYIRGWDDEDEDE